MAFPHRKDLPRWLLGFPKVPMGLTYLDTRCRILTYLNVQLYFKDPVKGTFSEVPNGGQHHIYF